MSADSGTRNALVPEAPLASPAVAQAGFSDAGRAGAFTTPGPAGIVTEVMGERTVC